ncbi:uncharacterized protein [Periplaneta americana]
MAAISGNFLVKGFTMAVILMLTARTAESIICFQCNSVRDPGCSVLMDNSTHGIYYKECEPVLGEKKSFFCRTIVQTIKDRGNLVRVVRTCGWERHPRLDCYEFEDEDHQEIVCQCFDDGCNSRAPGELRPSLLAALLVLLTFCLTPFFLE